MAELRQHLKEVFEPGLGCIGRRKADGPANPKWTIVQGQIVYVCCPPCTKKIEADPTTYLAEVDKLYSASLEAEKKAR